jgi:hypothetical protein
VRAAVIVFVSATVSRGDFNPARYASLPSGPTIVLCDPECGTIFVTTAPSAALTTVAVVDVEHQDAVSAEFEVVADPGHSREKIAAIRQAGRGRASDERQQRDGERPQQCAAEEVAVFHAATRGWRLTV